MQLNPISNVTPIAILENNRLTRSREIFGVRRPLAPRFAGEIRRRFEFSGISKLLRSSQNSNFWRARLSTNQLPIQSAADISVEQNGSRGRRTPKIMSLKITSLFESLAANSIQFHQARTIDSQRSRSCRLDRISPCSSEPDDG